MSVNAAFETIVKKAKLDLTDGLKDLNPKTPTEGYLYGCFWASASVGLYYYQVLQAQSIERSVCAGIIAVGGLANIAKGIYLHRKARRT